MLKILGITTIRSDYDLMSLLYQAMNQHDEIDLKLIVAGAHLSETYGKSINEIESDRLDILIKIETLIDSNSKASRIKTASLLLQNSIDIIEQYSPDLIVYAGDREDIIIGAMIGAYLEIPTAHFFGGDHVQDGHVDNLIRNAVSKLSSIHFVSNNIHKLRLEAMGENPERIFNLGSIGLDKFINHELLDKSELLNSFGIDRDIEQYALVIFHPGVDEKDISHIIIKNILIVLKSLGIFTFVSTPNTDPGNRNILSVFSELNNDPNYYFYKNLSRDSFLSVYKNSSILIGNSSSGILEAATIPIPVVNVGSRQKGRAQSGNVIFCGVEVEQIKGAIRKAVSKSFISRISNIKNIYGDGKSVQRVLRKIMNLELSDMQRKTKDPLDFINV